MMNIVYNLEKEYDEGYPCKRPKTKMSIRAVGNNSKVLKQMQCLSNFQTKTKFQKAPKQTWHYMHYDMKVGMTTCIVDLWRLKVFNDNVLKLNFHYAHYTTNNKIKLHYSVF